MKTLVCYYPLVSTLLRDRGAFIQYVTNEIIIACHNNGYYISESSAYLAWYKFSFRTGVYWRIPPKNEDQLFKIVKDYCEEMEQ